MENEIKDLTEKKIDLLWDSYKLFDEESGRLEIEMLRCFIYAAAVIAIPFGISKLVGDKNPIETIEKTRRMVPFAIILVYYYYLTLMYFVICVSIYKAGLEKKINALVGDNNLVNYNSLFTDKIYGMVFLPVFKKKKLMPTPNLVLAFLILGAIITVTYTEHLLAGSWAISFFVLCGITICITLYVFFVLSKVVKKEWKLAEDGN